MNVQTWAPSSPTPKAVRVGTFVPYARVHTTEHLTSSRLHPALAQRDILKQPAPSCADQPEVGLDGVNVLVRVEGAGE